VCGIVSGTAALIVVKTFFAATIERSLIKPFLLYSLALIAADVSVGLITLV